MNKKILLPIIFLIFLISIQSAYAYTLDDLINYFKSLFYPSEGVTGGVSAGSCCNCYSPTGSYMGCVPTSSCYGGGGCKGSCSCPTPTTLKPTTTKPTTTLKPTTTTSSVTCKCDIEGGRSPACGGIPPYNHFKCTDGTDAHCAEWEECRGTKKFPCVPIGTPSNPCGQIITTTTIPSTERCVELCKGCLKHGCNYKQCPLNYDKDFPSASDCGTGYHCCCDDCSDSKEKPTCDQLCKQQGCSGVNLCRAYCTGTDDMEMPKGSTRDCGVTSSCCCNGCPLTSTTLPTTTTTTPNYVCCIGGSYDGLCIEEFVCRAYGRGTAGRICSGYSDTSCEKKPTTTLKPTTTKPTSCFSAGGICRLDCYAPTYENLGKLDCPGQTWCCKEVRPLTTTTIITCRNEGESCYALNCCSGLVCVGNICRKALFTQIVENKYVTSLLVESTDTLWIALNKEGKPLEIPVISDDPAKLEYTPVASGKIKIIAITFEPQVKVFRTIVDVSPPS